MEDDDDLDGLFAYDFDGPDDNENDPDYEYDDDGDDEAADFDIDDVYDLMNLVISPKKIEAAVPPPEDTSFRLDEMFFKYLKGGKVWEIVEVEMLDDEEIEEENKKEKEKRSKFRVDLEWKSMKLSVIVDFKRKTIFTVKKTRLIGIIVNRLLDEKYTSEALNWLRSYRCSLSEIDDEMKSQIALLLLSTRSLDPIEWNLRPSREEEKIRLAALPPATTATTAVLFMPKNQGDLAELILKARKNFVDQPNIYAHSLFWSVAIFNKIVYETICQSENVRLLEKEEIMKQLNIENIELEEKILELEHLAMNTLLAFIIPGRDQPPTTTSTNKESKDMKKRLLAFLKSDYPHLLLTNDDIPTDTTVGSAAGMKWYRKMINKRSSLLEKFMDWIIKKKINSDDNEDEQQKMDIIFDRICYQAELAIKYFGMTTIQTTHDFIMANKSRVLGKKSVKDQADEFCAAYGAIYQAVGKYRFPYLGVLNSPRLKELSKKRYPDLMYCALRSAKKDGKGMENFGCDEKLFKTKTKKSVLRKLIKKDLKGKDKDEIRTSRSEKIHPPLTEAELADASDRIRKFFGLVG